MTNSCLREITIVARSAVDSMLSARLLEWGALECSIVRAQGGAPTSHTSDAHGEEYSRIETVVPSEIAQTITTKLSAEFNAGYPVLWFISEVSPHVMSSGECTSRREGRTSREQRWGDYVITV